MTEKLPVSCPNWITTEIWNNILNLSKDFPPHFQSLPEDIIRNNDVWKSWNDVDTPESIPLPMNYDKSLTPFRRLMILRCFRTDRVFHGVIDFIVSSLGERYIKPPNVYFNDIFNKTLAHIPIIFMLTSGFDPTNKLIKLANELGSDRFKCREISLGRGQEELAMDLVVTAAEQGSWILLQNCHLFNPIKDKMEKLLSIMENPHRDFRLWITTDTAGAIPIEILQRCFKVATDLSSGIRYNLRNSYHDLSQSILDKCPHAAFKSLVYVLAFFHAVIQERKRYDKIGWNINYDFSESDFNISVQIIDSYLAQIHKLQDNNINWKCLKYLIGEIIYGGRVMDGFDNRVVKTYLNEYMGEFIFDPFQPFNFYNDKNVKYTMPHNGNREFYLDYIDSLPLKINTSEVIGLHVNAEIKYSTQASRDIWRYLMDLQTQTSEVFDKNIQYQTVQSTAQNVLERVPKLYELEKIRETFDINTAPTKLILIQELKMFNKLLDRMTSSLNLLLNALNGEISLDPDLECIVECLFIGQLPLCWKKLAPKTCKTLGSWIEHFERRISQYNYWCTVGEPSIMWLSGLTIPESYLAAVVQMECQKHFWPLERSTFYTTVTPYTSYDEISGRPEKGCYVIGLYLEGCQWDLKNMCLKMSSPNVLVEEIPIIIVIPTLQQRLHLQNMLRTPVYITSQRRDSMEDDIVFEAHLRTTAPLSTWILHGVCLLLNTD